MCHQKYDCDDTRVEYAGKNKYCLSCGAWVGQIKRNKK